MADTEPYPQLRAVEVRVSCMLHDMQHMRGSAMVYNLGHGRTHQTTGEASCDACGDDKWLRIELFESEVTQVDHKEYAAALMAALESEIGTPEPEEEEVADEVEEHARETASPVVGAPVFQRPPLWGGRADSG